MYYQNPSPCIGWGWYLSNDFVFFLISLICILIYCHNEIIGYAFIIVIIGSGICIDIWKAYEDKMLVPADFSYKGEGTMIDIDFYFRP